MHSVIDNRGQIVRGYVIVCVPYFGHCAWQDRALRLDTAENIYIPAENNSVPGKEKIPACR